MKPTQGPPLSSAGGTSFYIKLAGPEVFFTAFPSYLR